MAQVVKAFCGNDDVLCRIVSQRLASRKEFKEAIARLLKGATDHRIALMCAEKEPLDCHRTILVSQELLKAGCEVQHIHQDGSLETHMEAAAAGTR
ncbi:DUF488 family protein [Paracoccus sp. (in: a-proteobacteria)]|uniref:DUF488 family protein n=1 Tax=Paracoccus sp. TaxID=267 RepID=UPI003FA68655